MKGYKMTINEVRRPPMTPVREEKEKENKDEKEKRLRSMAYDDEEVKPNVCRICGAILKYDGLGEYKCPDCNHSEYDSYGQVRKYLETHPGANIIQVEKGTGIPRSRITRMIAEERFKVSNGKVSFDE